MSLLNIKDLLECQIYPNVCIVIFFCNNDFSFDIFVDACRTDSLQ